MDTVSATDVREREAQPGTGRVGLHKGGGKAGVNVNVNAKGGEKGSGKKGVVVEKGLITCTIPAFD